MCFICIENLRCEFMNVTFKGTMYHCKCMDGIKYINCHLLAIIAVLVT